MSLNGVVGLTGLQAQIHAHIKQLSSAGATPDITLRQGARPVYLAALWRQKRRPVLVIMPRPEDARRLHDQLLTYLGEAEPVHLLPEPEVLPFERLAVDARTGNQRLTALAALAQAQIAVETENDSAAYPPLVITSVSAALRRTLPPEIAAGRGPAGESFTRLKRGQRIPRLDALLSAWLDLGYRHEPVVEGPGTFSHRGGIIDIYPTDSEVPYRIELWDDEIDTLRSFDPYTQRSVSEVNEVRLIPAREQLPQLADRAEVDRLIEGMGLADCQREVKERTEQDLVDLFSAPNIETLSLYNGLLNRNCLLDYLPATGLVVLDRLGQLESEALDHEEKFDRMRLSREERGELPRNFPPPYIGWRDFAPLLEGRQHDRVLLQSWINSEGDTLFSSPASFLGDLADFTEDVRARLRAGKAVVVVSQHARRLAEVLEEEEIGSNLTEDLQDLPQGGRVYLVPGTLREGWCWEGSDDSPPVTLLTDAEVFGTVKERRYRPGRSKTPAGQQIQLSDLIPGSYVVHIDHGVARFAGTTQMGNEGEEREYLVLEYADNDKLYVPTDHLDRVGAYVAAQDQTPSLTRLGTSEWARVKERVKGSTLEMAQELLNLYAARNIAEGHEFGQDTVWQRELEDSFPFEETPDQLRAIEEVKSDMEQRKPMDRLICGDVGYGKTEVALRATFKAVSEGMQVGLLVPTTVLAQQHYATFSDRLAPFPVQVEVLSRFRTNKEQQEVLEGLKSGRVDVVIGTHRLLQKDVHFKNLGLVVIDEEQRFGVSHKERLKRLRNEVDVLTLSATPIPRTLHMVLSGIRDMSAMDTPPEERLPIKTFVSEYSDDTIREAILRELERGGQVFFLHNRVRTIERKAAELQELVPEASFLIGHGQMPENELEDVMVSFANQGADVLVCTTIIESGLDLPNVNTLIIDRSDRFGLSQLYQLRGRVGRGEHRGYAYLLVPRDQRITEAAEQRIQAILEAGELGSGIRIAMRDLEIRGAGNLLGAAQSGQIHAVGLDLYGQLLQEAVQELLAAQGSEGPEGTEVKAPVVRELPRVELPITASIPEDYIDHLPTRMALYQRLTRVQDRKQVPDLREELRDRFGPLPEAMENLLLLVDLRALGSSLGIESIVQSRESITLSFRDSVGSARVPLQRALGPSVNVGNQQMHLSWRCLGDQWFARLTRTLERLQVFQERLREVAVPS